MKTFVPAIVGLLAACSAAPGPVSELPPATFELSDAEVLQVVEGCFANALPPSQVGADREEIEMLLIGATGSLPAEAGGYRLLPYDPPEEHDYDHRLQLLIDSLDGDSMLVTFKIMNPIGGPSVYELHFARSDGGWRYDELVAATEYL